MEQSRLMHISHLGSFAHYTARSLTLSANSQRSGRKEKSRAKPHHGGTEPLRKHEENSCTAGPLRNQSQNLPRRSQRRVEARNRIDWLSDEKFVERPRF